MSKLVRRVANYVVFITFIITAVLSNLTMFFIVVACAVPVASIVTNFTFLFLIKALGIPILGFNIGPMHLAYVDGKRRISWHRRFQALSSIDVDVTALPPAETVAAMRRAIAGSVLAFLALMVTGLGAWLLFADLSQTYDQVWLGIIVAIGVDFVMMLIPGEGRPGFLIQLMWRGGVRAENYARATSLRVCMHKPWRPRDWPQGLVDLADELSTKPTIEILPESKFVAVIYLYNHLADSGAKSEGLACLDRLAAPKDQLRKPNPGYPVDAITLIRALHYALWDDDPSGAESALSIIPDKSSCRKDAIWFMASALVQRSRGDFLGARMSVDAAHHIIDPGIERFGVLKMNSEWLNIIEQRINNAASVSSPMPISAG